MSDKDLAELNATMHDVKMLLILQLLGQGFRQSQIAKILDVSEATMSRMLPKGLARSGIPRTKQEAGEVDG